MFGDEVGCARCGKPVDTKAAHCLHCAPGPSTAGHNRVVDVCLGLAHLSDWEACVEARGLLPGAQTLRPADILTTAAFGRECALDVGIACPDVAGAGDDACAAMVRTKRKKREPYRAEFESEDIQYRPIVWSCWGRPHPDATAALRPMAYAAARRKPGLRAEALYRRTRTEVGVHIWKRTALMVDACRPRTGAKSYGLEERTWSERHTWRMPSLGLAFSSGFQPKSI